MFYQKDLKKRCGDGERVDVRIRNSLLVSGLIGRRRRGVSILLSYCSLVYRCRYGIL